MGPGVNRGQAPGRFGQASLSLPSSWPLLTMPRFFLYAECGPGWWHCVIFSMPMEEAAHHDRFSDKEAETWRG